jgi:hypothetical protein
MTLSEALCDDLEAIEDGVFSLLPHTDASGRNLLYTVPGRRAEGRYSSESMVRGLLLPFLSAPRTANSQ